MISVYINCIKLNCDKICLLTFKLELVFYQIFIEIILHRILQIYLYLFYVSISLSSLYCPFCFMYSIHTCYIFFCFIWIFISQMLFNSTVIFSLYWTKMEKKEKEVEYFMYNQTMFNLILCTYVDAFETEIK